MTTSYLTFNSRSMPSLSQLSHSASGPKNRDPNQLQNQHGARGTGLRTGRLFAQHEKKATARPCMRPTAAVPPAAPCQEVGTAGERQLQAGVTANPQATLLHLLWPEPKSSLSSSKQEATAELHDTRTHPKRPPLLLPPANTAVNTCKENTCVCQGVGQGRTLPYWS